MDSCTYVYKNNFIHKFALDAGHEYKYALTKMREKCVEISNCCLPIHFVC